jgi:hypothetical protein
MTSLHNPAFLTGRSMKMASSLWQLFTVTSGIRDAQTDSDISVKLTIHNESGYWVTDPANLDNPENNFQEGEVDIFNIEFPALKETAGPTYIHFTVHGKNGWCLHAAYLMSRDNGRIYVADLSAGERWIDDGTWVTPLYAFGNGKTDGSPATETPLLTINTSAVPEAGTDADVYAVLIDKDGFASNCLLLNHIGEDFAEGSTYSEIANAGRKLSTVQNILLFIKGLDGWLPASVRVSDATTIGYPTTSASTNQWLEAKHEGYTCLLEQRLTPLLRPNPWESILHSSMK